MRPREPPGWLTRGESSLPLRTGFDRVSIAASDADWKRDGSMMDARLLALLDDLRALPAETAWLEFKENNVPLRV